MERARVGRKKSSVRITLVLVPLLLLSISIISIGLVSALVTRTNLVLRVQMWYGPVVMFC